MITEETKTNFFNPNQYDDRGEVYQMDKREDDLIIQA